MKPLTKAEEQVMQALWSLQDRGQLKEIVEQMPYPTPHQNTVATLLKILVDKKYVGIRVMGRFHHYYPLVQKDLYTSMALSGLTNGYFDGSYQEVVSFLVDQKKLSVKDLELLLKQLKSGKK